MRHRLVAALEGASAEVRGVLSRALERTEEMSAADCAMLLRRSARRQDLVAVLAAADEVRYLAVGDGVSYVVNRNINFTNACTKRCGFCAFSRTAIDGEAYLLPVSEIVRRAREAVRLGATELCVQAGLPDVDEDGARWTGDSYLRVVEAVRGAVPPGVHLHALSPEEVLHGARRSKRPVADFLADAKAAGVGSLPGTSAEILDDDVRAKLAKGRLSTRDWLDVIETAHQVGLPTTSTMMYGCVEDEGHVAAHLETLRDLQRRTGGLTEFVPLPFVASEAPFYKDPDARARLGVRGGPSRRETLAVHAVSRLMLDGFVRNVQASWPKVGLDFASALLRSGANDLGGVLMNESISVAAGATAGQLATPGRLRGAAERAGRTLFRRSTTYGAPPTDLYAVAADETFEATDFSSYAELTARPHWRVRDALKRRRKRPPPLAGARAAFSTAARPDVVTYSECYTVVPTYECFNNCTYCSFKEPISTKRPRWKDLEAMRDDLAAVVDDGVCEVLVLGGEVRPDAPNRKAWHALAVAVCEAALDLGLLPHTNIGPLSFQEMDALAEVNASMGLMLEQVAPALRAPGAVHHRAPSKDPALRLEQLDMAGRIQIPFTTGILCGIGETADDRLDSLDAIAESHGRYSHIQEVIVQPFSPDPSTRFKGGDPVDMPALVAAARSRLPDDVRVQVPPNLVGSGDGGDLVRCLENGARDVGGISPVDHVNRRYDFPPLPRLRASLAASGFDLQPRLPVHDAFVPWLRPRVLDVYRRRWAPKGAAVALY